MRSSLNKNRVDKLPIIHRRRQVSSSVAFGFGGRDGNRMPMPKRKVKIQPVRSELTRNLPIPERGSGLIEVEEYIRHYDNPEVSDTVWVDGKLEWSDRLSTISNLSVSADLVKMLNHKHRKDAGDAARAAKHYAATLALFNICWKCRQPIQTKTACVPRGLTDEQVKNERLWLTKKGYKRSIAVFDTKGKKAFSYPRQEPARTAASEIKNVTYADCKPHYELRQYENGKFFYALIDGTNVLKGTRVVTGRIGDREFKRLEYFVLSTGEALPNYHVPSTYRVFNLKCVCKVARG